MSDFMSISNCPPHPSSQLLLKSILPIYKLSRELLFDKHVSVQNLGHNFMKDLFFLNQMIKPKHDNFSTIFFRCFFFNNGNMIKETKN